MKNKPIIKDSDKTKSFYLFKDFCTQNKIKFTPIEASDNEKMNDGDIFPQEKQIYTEIVQFDKSDININKSNSITTYWSNAENRVRKKIDKCVEQLKSRINKDGKKPTLIVMYDNSPVDPIDHTDIKCAMHGKESIDLIFRNNQLARVSPLYLGKNRKIAKGYNTSISALSMLYKDIDSNLSLDVFLNEYSSKPINPLKMKNKNIQYFTLDENKLDWIKI